MLSHSHISIILKWLGHIGIIVEMFISLTIVFIGGFRWGSGIMGVASASLNLKKGEIK